MLEYHDVCARISNDCVVSNDVIDGLEKFTCKLYGKSYIDTIRYYIIKSKCGPGNSTVNLHKSI